MKIVVVCGTNREGALSRLLAQEVAESYRQRGQSVDLLDMVELPPEVYMVQGFQEALTALTAADRSVLDVSGVSSCSRQEAGSDRRIFRHLAIDERRLISRRLTVV